MQTGVDNIQQALLIATSNVMTTIISFIPTFFAALLVIVFGVFVARWAKWLVVKLLEAVKLSNTLKDSPIENFLQKAEITNKIEEVLGNLIRWIVLLVFFIAAVNLLGLTTVSSFLSNILGYLPRVISAALILTVGTVVAGLVESLIKGSLSHISRPTGRLVGKVGSYIVIIFTLLAAIAELGIAADLINTLFIGFVAMLALGFGLAFGLGAKDLVSKILDDWYSNLKSELK
ncbi:hypothetical protein ACFL2V_05630 [Pseudomonadota bacterium]